MHRGYVSVYRKIQDSYIWQIKPYSPGHAWVDLILLANHKEGRIDVRGILVTVKRGQVGWSFKRLANKCGWSEGQVKRFHLQLENDAQISVQKNNVTSLITIKNYDKYHPYGAQNGDQTESRQRADGAQAETNNNNESLEQGKEIAIAGPPNKTGEDWPFISMPELALLRSVPGYTFDLDKDFAKLGELSLEFPMVDVTALLKNWKEYITDTPFKKKSSPRAQLRNQFIMAKNKGMHKKESDNGDDTRRPDAGDRIKKAEEAFEKQEGQPS